ncbi:DUF2939 domain-containing protein [Lichenicola sp.]|uniref:DUF2939 domain-containing protein n=1 Tax=Lichenicola sp. TaxID=2804529 RepID=UPI003B00C2A9
MPRRTLKSRLLRSARLPAGCLVASFTLYAVSPFVTLWSVAAALQNDDVGTIQEALDWRTVRTGLKTDLDPGAPVSLASAHAAPVQDDLPDFGESFATTIVSHVVDDVVTPEHLVAMLVQAKPAHHGSTADTHAGGLLAMLDRVDHVSFVSPNEFEASVRLVDDRNAAPVTVSMRIEKWKWKITRIHVPDELLTQGSPQRT